MKAVILCAGLGTRLRPLTDTIPKVMVEIGGKPLLQHHIEWLVGQGVRDIGINLFYLPHVITESIGDGSQFGARIYYSKQETLSETASGFRNFKDFVGDDTCLVIYGDNFFSLDVEDFNTYHKTHGGIASVALRKWENPESKGIVGLNSENKILWFKEKPKQEEITTNIGNAGIYLVEPEIFSHINQDRDYDFGKDIFPSLLEKKKIYGYHLPGYHIDIGTLDTLTEARDDYPLQYPHKAVFLDRDGVLNIKPPEHDYVKKFEEFSWVPSAKKLIQKIKSNGFLAVVISNQQGIARGFMTKEFIESLHEKMNMDLSEIGTHIDAFYYCPHHKDDMCTCRKPNPGMLFHASHELGIDLTKSFFIGDTLTDMEAGKKAGVKSFLIESDTIPDDLIEKILNAE